MEKIEKRLDLIPKITKISLQIKIGVGALIILIYCGRVGYYPSGLTIGDGFLFIAVALSFGFLYSAVVFLLFCTAITLTQFWRLVQIVAVHAYKLWLKIKRQARQAEKLAFPLPNADQLSITITGIPGAILIIISFFYDLKLGFGLSISVALMVFSYRLINAKTINDSNSAASKETQNKIKLGLSILIYLTPLIVGNFQVSLLNQTMRLIGVRTEDATVQFKGEYKQFVDSSLSTKDKSLYQAKVLFNGLGTSSVLEIEETRFVVPNNEYFLHYK